jgi:putative heme-binding domain-containing protein
VDPIGLNVGAMHALWTLAGLADGGPSSAALGNAASGALSHEAAGVRRSAVAVLPRSDRSTQAILSAGLLRDADPQVRLAALLALADMPESGEAAAALATLAVDPAWESDRWLSDALMSAAAAHASHFLPALAAVSAAGQSAGDQRELRMARRIAEHVARGVPEAEALSSLVTGVGRADAPLLAAIWEGFAAGWPRGRTLRITDEASAVLVGLLDRLPTASQAQLIRLGVAWGSRELESRAEIVIQSLGEILRDAQQPVSQRISAATQLVDFRPRSELVVDQLLELVSPQSAPALAEGAVEALSSSSAEALGRKMVERAGTVTPALRRTIVLALLARAETAAALLDGFESGLLPWSDLSLDQKQALSRHPDQVLQARARALMAATGGLPNPDRQRVLEERLPLAQRSGDAALGKAVFQKHCTKCHRHGGEGENIGPDLTGMAVHPKTEMLAHILDPSRSVEGNFRLYTVVTHEGRVINGMLAGESRTALELVDTEAKRHAVQRSEIEQLIPSRSSVMPDGFEKQATDEELVNLLEFLASKGRYLPLALRQAATISSAEGMFTNKTDRRERLVFPDWSPKTFADVPFYLVDPQDGRIANVILLHGPAGTIPPQMPRQVSLPVNAAAKAIHLLSGVSGWGYPGGEEGSVSLIVRVQYADGTSEDHALKNGQHFADYARRVDVPESQFAFDLRGRQVRYLAVRPGRSDRIARIDLVKGPDNSAPIVLAVTVETDL